jgi:hypothetical protein
MLSHDTFANNNPIRYPRAAILCVAGMLSDMKKTPYAIVLFCIAAHLLSGSRRARRAFCAVYAGTTMGR